MEIQCMDMVPSPIQVKSSLNDNVQDQQLLTLHTISPLWAKRLEKSKLLPLLSFEPYYLLNDYNCTLNLEMLQSV
jgi:hypothetical protein